MSETATALPTRLKSDNIQLGHLYTMPGLLLQHLKERHGACPSTIVTCTRLEIPAKVTVNEHLLKHGIVEYESTPYKGFTFVSGSNRYHRSQLTFFTVSREEIKANQGDIITVTNTKGEKVKEVIDVEELFSDLGL
jgi:hypothetical protein